MRDFDDAEKVESSNRFACARDAFNNPVAERCLDGKSSCDGGRSTKELRRRATGWHRSSQD